MLTLWLLHLQWKSLEVGMQKMAFRLSGSSALAGEAKKSAFHFVLCDRDLESVNGAAHMTTLLARNTYQLFRHFVSVEQE